jgi:hypothetical protein
MAAKDPDEPDRFVAALFIPNNQLLVISARYAVPSVLESKMSIKQYREVYLDLQGAALPDSSLFIQDMKADGLCSNRDQAADVVYEAREDPADIRRRLEQARAFGTGLRTTVPQSRSGIRPSPESAGRRGAGSCRDSIVAPAHRGQHSPAAAVSGAPHEAGPSNWHRRSLSGVRRDMSGSLARGGRHLFVSGEWDAPESNDSQTVLAPDRHRCLKKDRKAV